MAKNEAGFYPETCPKCGARRMMVQDLIATFECGSQIDSKGKTLKECEKLIKDVKTRGYRVEA